MTRMLTVEYRYKERLSLEEAIRVHKLIEEIVGCEAYNSGSMVDANISDMDFEVGDDVDAKEIDGRLKKALPDMEVQVFVGEVGEEEDEEDWRGAP